MQGGHASVQFMKEAAMEGMEAVTMYLSPVQRDWLFGRQKKICLQVPSEEALVQVYDECREAGVKVCAIVDAGLTELPGRTLTCIGIGPDTSENIDPITAKLSLY
jgi:peptidyl-tRNA hydrolase